MHVRTEASAWKIFRTIRTNATVQLSSLANTVKVVSRNCRYVRCVYYGLPSSN